MKQYSTCLESSGFCRSNPRIIPITIAFDYPEQLCYHNGCMYLGQTEDIVSEYSLDGEVLRTWGDGMKNPFFCPRAVDFDKHGNMWISDTNNGLVHKMQMDGTILATYAGFDFPEGIAVGAKGVYVADSNNNAIKFIDAGGVISTVCGAFHPNGVCFDRTGNELWFTDCPSLFGAADRATCMTYDPMQLKWVFERSVAGLHNPYQIAVDLENNLLVANGSANGVGGDTVVKIDRSTWLPTVLFTDLGCDSTTFDNPHGVQVDSDGNIWVSDCDHRLLKIFYP